MGERLRIFATTDIGKEALDRPREKGWEVEVCDHLHPPPKKSSTPAPPTSTGRAACFSRSSGTTRASATASTRWTWTLSRTFAVSSTLGLEAIVECFNRARF